jgi:hypothetical protein
MSVANYCASCGQDFASVRAFDRHRTGSHEHGRRCLEADEMRAAGLELDSRGRWQLLAEAEATRERFAAQIAAGDRRCRSRLPPAVSSS